MNNVFKMSHEDSEIPLETPADFMQKLLVSLRNSQREKEEQERIAVLARENGIDPDALFALAKKKIKEEQKIALENLDIELKQFKFDI